MPTTSYYAVKKGKIPGIYITWKEAEQQVKGYQQPIFKKFATLEEAQQFMGQSAANIQAKQATARATGTLIKAETLEKLKQLTVMDYLKYKESDAAGMLTKKHPNTWTKQTGKYYIMTDGSRKTAPGGDQANTERVGYGVYFGLDSVNLAQEMPIDTTNNQCELLAIQRALEAVRMFAYALKDQTVVIVSDSQYSLNCITEWLEGWKTADWHLASGEPVKNPEIIKAIDAILTDIEDNTRVTLEFQHQNSHTKASDIKTKKDKMLWEGNFIVDYLAKGCRL
jgi:ribonuclease HI